MKQIKFQCLLTFFGTLCIWVQNRGKQDCASEYIIKEKATHLGTKSGKMSASGDIFGENAIKNRPS